MVKTAESRDIYRSHFESSGIATLIAGKDGTISYVNQRFLDLSGYQRSEMEGIKKWSELIVNGNLTKMKQYHEFIDHNATVPAHSYEFKLAASKGSIRDVQIFRNPLIGTNDTAIFFVDITDLVRSRKQVSISEEKYRSLIESTDDSVYMVDRDCTYIFVNRQVLARLCVTETKIIGKRYGDFHDADDALEFAGYVEKVYETAASQPYEHRSGKDGQRCMLRTLSPIVEGGTGQVKFVAVVSKDITDLKKTEEKLKYLSLHDPLTSLYNRAYFEEEMHRLDNSRFELVGLIMCDIDFFKKFNDTYGHSCGDEVLKGVAKLIQNQTRSVDVAARYGGEEFCMLLPDTDEIAAVHIAERIRLGVEGMGFDYDGQKLSVTLSIGVARYDPNRDLTGKSVIDRADKAMYLAKQGGRNRVMASR